jgi:hypothetical protein
MVYARSTHPCQGGAARAMPDKECRERGINGARHMRGLLRSWSRKLFGGRDGLVGLVRSFTTPSGRTVSYHKRCTRKETRWHLRTPEW